MPLENCTKNQGKYYSVKTIRIGPEKIELDISKDQVNSTFSSQMQIHNNITTYWMYFES